MSSPTFVPSASVPTRPHSTSISTCTFAARPALRPAARARRVSPLMMAEGYVIKQSEFRDPESEDDGGDGFMGEADMDDCLGVSMPEDLPGFEIREIQNTRNRDELIDKLQEIKDRRKDVLDDRRKGMGIDNVGNYLENL